MSDQENLIRKLQSENEAGRATIGQLKERMAILSLLSLAVGWGFLFTLWKAVAAGE